MRTIKTVTERFQLLVVGQCELKYFEGLDQVFQLGEVVREQTRWFGTGSFEPLQDEEHSV